MSRALEYVVHSSRSNLNLISGQAGRQGARETGSGAGYAATLSICPDGRPMLMMMKQLMVEFCIGFGMRITDNDTDTDTDTVLLA